MFFSIFLNLLESFFARINILSFFPLPALTHPVFSLKSTSFGLRFTISETRRPEEYTVVKSVRSFLSGQINQTYTSLFDKTSESFF